MPRPCLPALIAAAGLLLSSAEARAHMIETQLQRSAGGDHPHAMADGVPSAARLSLHSSFSSGEPASGARVRLLSAGAAAPRELGRTNSEGRLSFLLPADVDRNAEIQVDAGPGHRDWIALAELDDALSAGSDARASQRQAPLLSAAPFAALGLLGGVVAAGLRRRRR